MLELVCEAELYKRPGTGIEIPFDSAVCSVAWLEVSQLVCETEASGTAGAKGGLLIKSAFSSVTWLRFESTSG